MGETESVRETHIHNTRTGQYAIRHQDWLLIDAKDGYVSPQKYCLGKESEAILLMMLCLLNFMI